jgi:hypothetical protein
VARWRTPRLLRRSGGCRRLARPAAVAAGGCGECSWTVCASRVLILTGHYGDECAGLGPCLGRPGPPGTRRRWPRIVIPGPEVTLRLSVGNVSRSRYVLAVCGLFEVLRDHDHHRDRRDDGATPWQSSCRPCPGSRQPGSGLSGLSEPRNRDSDRGAAPFCGSHRDAGSKSEAIPGLPSLRPG